MVETGPLIANINDLTTFLSIITAVCGSYLIFLIGFFVLDFIGWLDFPSDSSAHEKQYVKRNAVDESGFTIKHGNINSNIPRAKLMFPYQFEKKTEISADGNKIKEESATEKEAVGYVNKLFSEILDQEYDKKSLDSGKVVVSAEINNQEDSVIKVLPTNKISGNLSSFKPNRNNFKEKKINSSIKMEATVL